MGREMGIVAWAEKWALQ